MRSYSSRVGSYSNMISVFIRRKERNTEREDGHMMTETEIGGMHLQVKECQRLPAGPRSCKRQGRILPYKLWREPGPADTLISDSSFQNCETIHFCCFKIPSLRYFVTSALGI